MHTSQPIGLMLHEQPAAAGRNLFDAVVRLRCTGCGGRELTLHLCVNGHRPGPVSGYIKLGWALLHDEMGACKAGSGETSEVGAACDRLAPDPGGPLA